jgi:hypothetical protein
MQAPDFYPLNRPEEIFQPADKKGVDNSPKI